MEISGLLEGIGLWGIVDVHVSKLCDQYLDMSTLEKDSVLEAHLNESSDDGE